MEYDGVLTIGLRWSTSTPSCETPPRKVLTAALVTPPLVPSSPEKHC